MSILAQTLLLHLDTHRLLQLAQISSAFPAPIQHTTYPHFYRQPFDQLSQRSHTRRATYISPNCLNDIPASLLVNKFLFSPSLLNLILVP